MVLALQPSLTSDVPLSNYSREREAICRKHPSLAAYLGNHQLRDITDSERERTKPITTPFRRAREHRRWESLGLNASFTCTTSLNHSSNPAPNLSAEVLEASGSDLNPQKADQTDLERDSVAASSNELQDDDGTEAFGPNYVHAPKAESFDPSFDPLNTITKIPEEHTLRNDYSQHFVDTGAGMLPGNAVRNPFEETRFDDHSPAMGGSGPQTPSRSASNSPLIHSRPLSSGYATPTIGAEVQASESSLSPDVGSRSTSQVAHINKGFHLSTLMPIKYDVVLIDPPLESYEWEGLPKEGSNLETGRPWSWAEIAALPIPQLAAKESFVFLWVGSGAGDGLERGREVLTRWGYRRCEDIVWVRTNPTARAGDVAQASTSSAFTRTVQHCLMGIRGTVRRSTDTRFVHCNVDTDVILWEGEQADPTKKPPEMHRLIENFCLGTRRLELFGRNRNLRRGWLTLGLELGPQFSDWPLVGLGERTEGDQEDSKAGSAKDKACRSPPEHVWQPREYTKLWYDSNFGVDRPGCELKDRKNLVPFSEDCEILRPKSPPGRGGGGGGGGGGRTVGGRDQVVGLGGGTPMTMKGGMGAYSRGGGGGRDGFGHAVPGGGGMPRGLSNDPALRRQFSNMALGGQQYQQFYGVQEGSSSGSGFQAQPFYSGGIGLGSAMISSGLPPNPSTGPSNHGAAAVPGGAGLSGLGAGGPRTVSIPSGSDTLSGPQASVLRARGGNPGTPLRGAVGRQGKRRG
ncbi:MT-A70-domain-containing protein [Violaceomyces palustris]|uniref:MT-A70-domain-containing protein n=1 Tax=Violaceomyces palustris TaxID=1673888 RepID=A0ACD0NXN6_9BASI|nr:MT-A70-domain-containing protein [Violaceomyces palustris]